MEPEDLREGDVIAGKFRVERILAVGGMGVVASAWHLDLEHRVALKILRSFDADPDAAERFAREARAAARLQSEHVVRTFDVGKLDDGRPYLVMEYLVGEDLEEVLAQRTLGVGEAVALVLQACEAIAEAHAASIVHRDLKPANLFAARRASGRVVLKVLDFGIAKRVDKSIAPLTGRHVAIGSPAYMSPEQTRGDADVGPATDIWSLGVCLYELLVGETPFHASSFAEIHLHVLRGKARPVHERRPEVPLALSDVIARCLEKDPAKRYPDVASLAAALEPFADAVATRSDAPPSSSPASRRERDATTLVEAAPVSWRGLLVAMGTALLVACAVVAWQSHAAARAGAPAPPAVSAR